MRTGTRGTMGVDYEQRVDFDRLRRDRVANIKRELEKTDFSCLLLYDTCNKRYATSTASTSPECDNMGRYAIVPRHGEPYIFGFGSEVAAAKLNCPWIADRAFPAHTTMYGALPNSLNPAAAFLRDLDMVFEAEGISHSDPIGFDVMDAQLLLAVQAAGYRLGDGMEVMQSARMVKTDDELEIARNACATVDAAWDGIARMLRPGVRENEVQGEAARILHRLGAQWVHNVQVTTGSRTNPHPHLSSDRLLQPGDLFFADVVTVWNGYQTCIYRTLCVGKPTQRQKDVYKSAYDMLMAGLGQIKAGNTTADVARAWPGPEHWGFKTESEAFGLAFGHGVGVGLWERPIIHRLFSLDNPIELREGMVLALETYDGRGEDGARIEVEVIVTADGYELISKFPIDELIACGGTYS